MSAFQLQAPLRGVAGRTRALHVALMRSGNVTDERSHEGLDRRQRVRAPRQEEPC